ncbi:ribosomal RNA small subunit methyltransferase A [Candidatus Uhrbacteria bacterium]|nr:ribosomal RNA small subunit methyltransferase A [Candidatus Uhrbacteria bacterium]
MLPRAKKSYGQNWLVDETVIAKIIAAAEIVPGEAVLEIGPGTGVLTQALVDAGARVTAVEADRDLVGALKMRFGDKIELIQGNVLEIRVGYMDEYKVVANIPYNITSDVLKKFLTVEPRPSRMVLMLQREVTDRIVAVPPQMSLLSVVCQIYAHCRKVANVPAGAFRPIPKVDSAIVRLDIRHEREQWLPPMNATPESIIALAKAGFSSPRKQLHHNLSAHLHLPAEQVKEALQSLGLDPKIRAEALTPEQWIQLTHLWNTNA